MYQKKYQDIPSFFYDQLEELYERSSHTYIDGVGKESDCFERRRDLQQINYYTSFLEEYVHTLMELGYIREYHEVVKKLKRIKVIKILPHKERMFLIRLKNDCIELNPEMDQEQNKIRIYSKFTSLLHKNWMDDVTFFLEENEVQEKEEVADGFKLIDCATSMDTADHITSYIKKENLPQKSILQVAARDFSDTIIDREDSLKQMSIESLVDDFVRKLDLKYKEDIRLKQNMVQMIGCLGKIHQANNDSNELRRQQTAKLQYQRFLSIVEDGKKIKKYKR